MKNKSILGLLMCITLIPFAGFGQQKSSGVIDYTMTMERRNFNNRNSDSQDNQPREFTQKKQLTFNQTSGKFASEKSNERAGMFGTQYVNFQNKSFLQAFKRKGNDTTFYIAQPFKNAESFKLTGKTKTILGYNAKEATATMRNGKVTIWYTTDIPVTFSPMNGLTPPEGGLVLDIQNNMMHYQATKIDLKNVNASDVSIPSPSRELSKEEVKNMRGNMRGGNMRGGNARGDRRNSGNFRRN